MVWASVALQACDTWPQASELIVDRLAQVEAQHLPSDQSGHVSDHDCARCLDCRHDGCVEPSFCEGPVVFSSKAETRLPDNTEFESPVVAAINDLDLIVNSTNTPLERSKYRVSAATVPLTVQYCVYLI
jgi:hypothetical protein